MTDTNQAPTPAPETPTPALPQPTPQGGAVPANLPQPDAPPPLPAVDPSSAEAFAAIGRQHAADMEAQRAREELVALTPKEEDGIRVVRDAFSTIFGIVFPPREGRRHVVVERLLDEIADAAGY